MTTASRSSSTNSHLDDLLQDLEAMTEESHPPATGSIGSHTGPASNSAVKTFIVPRPPETEKNSSITNPKAKFVHMRNGAEQTIPKNAMSQNSSAPSEVDNILDLIGPPSPDQVCNAATNTASTPPPSAIQAKVAGTSYTGQSGSKNVTLGNDSQNSVDDFLNDLDAALMPSPRRPATQLLGTGKGANTPPLASNTPSVVSKTPPRTNGGSLQQRMFPTMGASPPTKDDTGSTNFPPRAKASSFEESSTSHLPPTGQPVSAVASRHTVAAIESSSGANGLSNVGSLVDIGSKIGKKNVKCVRVTLAGAEVARGAKTSSFSKCACDHLRCIQCNFEVLYFKNCKWAADADYMFFRNSVPNVEKLNTKLGFSAGPEDEQHNFCAYCCQCSWVNVKEERTLGPMIGSGEGQLHWVCAGHGS